jgi:F-type H+-transporting ATPase subunit delta
MQNPRLAGRYAKSLIDLATEKSQLEVVYKDVQYLKAVCKASQEFANLLRSPIIKADKKLAIINAVIGSNVSDLTSAFIRLLTSKGRESDLLEIVNAFIEQYDALKQIHRVKLTTAVPVGEDVKNAIVAKIKSEAKMPEIELEHAVNDDLIGGFVIEFDNKLFDASVRRDLEDIKKQFSLNLFESKVG